MTADPHLPAMMAWVRDYVDSWQPGQVIRDHFVSGGGGIAVYEPDLESVPTEAGGGFHHFVTATINQRLRLEQHECLPPFAGFSTDPLVQIFLVNGLQHFNLSICINLAHGFNNFVT